MTLVKHLGILDSAGLLRLAAAQPELEYMFRHALIQDAAHASLVKRDRVQLHRAVGETLERLHAECRDEFAPVLARHFAEAGDDRRALEYFTLAGDVAARAYANTEAAEHYAQAIANARRITAEEQLKSLYLKCGRALQSSGRYWETWANYVEMESVARERGDRSLELASLIEQATLRSVYSPIIDQDLARTLLDRALALAGGLDDHGAEARILWTLMRITVFSGEDPTLATLYGERSLVLAREYRLHEQLAYTLNDIQYAYRSVGQIDRALAALDEARDLWRVQGNLHMLADNLNQAASIYGFSGRLAQALALADEAYQISMPSNNVTQQALSQLIAGQVYTYLGRPDRALENLERARSLGSPLGTGPSDAMLALLFGSFGAIERALASARRLYDVARSTPLYRVVGVTIVSTLGWLHALKGDLDEAERMVAEAHGLTGIRVVGWMGGAQLLLAEGELALARRDYPRVVESMQRTAATLRAQGVHVHVPEALYLAARALLALDRLEEARAILCEARAEAEAMGTRYILWQILIALSRVEEQRGNPAEAESLRRQAREVIGDIADHCPSDLRASFLNLPDVKEAIPA
jgi:tetratricopeptide (TPR) repeat protein